MEDIAGERYFVPNLMWLQDGRGLCERAGIAKPMTLDDRSKVKPSIDRATYRLGLELRYHRASDVGSTMPGHFFDGRFDDS